MSSDEKIQGPGNLFSKKYRFSQNLSTLVRKLILLSGSLIMIAGVVCLSVLTSLLNSTTVLSAVETPPPITPAFDRLAEPTLPPNPSQADLGAVDYWLVCMVCHGDRGQGLTEEWRAAAGEEDMNCWQSRCHASNHPPEGFELPTFAPRIIGEGSLARFVTAAEVHDFISEKMPWQMPGMLEEDAYWRLTAFLLRENGLNLGTSQLGPQNADQVYLRNGPSLDPVEDSAGITKLIQDDPSVETHAAQEELNSNLGPGLVGFALAGMILIGLVSWLFYRARRTDDTTEWV